MESTVKSTLSLLLHGNQLKRTARTGWAQRGVPEAENVAAHTYGVAFIALVLAAWMEEKVNVEKLLTMAILHDLPEALTSDIPSPAWRYLPEGVKQDAEEHAMADILGDIPFANQLLQQWRHLQNPDSVEARLVHDADKLDMYLQAFQYEQHTANRQLQEFWDGANSFHSAQAQALFDELSRRRVESNE